MKLSEIAEYLELSCDFDIEISGLNSLLDANSSELTFLENKKYVNDLKNTKAAAVLITLENSKELPSSTVALICEEPYLALAKISKLFAPNIIEIDGEKPIVGGGTKVMPNVYIGKNSKIGSDCTIMAGAFIGDNVTVGTPVVESASVVATVKEHGKGEKKINFKYNKKTYYRKKGHRQQYTAIEIKAINA